MRVFSLFALASQGRSGPCFQWQLGSSHRFSGAICLIGAANCSWVLRSTGLCLMVVPAGYCPRKFPPFQWVAGLIGRGQKPPPQLGHTLPRISSTQLLQKVHSKVQIMASRESGGNGLLQFSQVGLSSSMASSPCCSANQTVKMPRHSVCRCILRCAVLQARG